LRLHELLEAEEALAGLVERLGVLAERETAEALADRDVVLRVDWVSAWLGYTKRYVAVLTLGNRDGDDLVSCQHDIS
jgi:hypothetical protein